MEAPNQPSEYFKKFRLLLEYQYLSNAGLEGIVVYPSHENPFSSIDGTLLVHSGFWTGSKVHFSVSLPTDGSAPSLKVSTRNLYHPLVSPNDGSIATLHSVQAAPQGSVLYPLVFTLHKLFTTPLAQLIGSCESIKDENAAQMFKEDKEGFARQIKENSQFLENIDSSSPYRIQNAGEWSIDMQNLLEEILGPEDGIESSLKAVEEMAESVGA
jgi:ubiquitin-protein ligase